MNEFKAYSIEWNLFRDYFQLFKKYSPPQTGSVDYWTNMAKDQNEFLKKYGVKKVSVPEQERIPLLAQKLAITMADYIEEIAKLDTGGD